jgi:hypothetical protein
MMRLRQDMARYIAWYPLGVISKDTRRGVSSYGAGREAANEMKMTTRSTGNEQTTPFTTQDPGDTGRTNSDQYDFQISPKDLDIFVSEFIF